MPALFSDEVILVTDLRKNLSACLEKARDGLPITIMQGNKADVALVRRDTLAEAYRQLEEIQTLRDTLEGLIETYEILNDPEMMDKIRRGEEAIVADRYVTLKELKAELGIS
jgi:antitoxin (DNA-binding transcriptional repressor) of toxin-antitoxin stability system